VSLARHWERRGECLSETLEPTKRVGSCTSAALHARLLLSRAREPLAFPVHPERRHLLGAALWRAL